MQAKSEETFHRLKTTTSSIWETGICNTATLKDKGLHAYRTGWTTSTKFHYATTTDKLSKTKLIDIMQYNNENVPSLLRGENMEEMARQAYTAFMAWSHQDFRVSSCGLVAQPSEPVVDEGGAHCATYPKKSRVSAGGFAKSTFLYLECVAWTTDKMIWPCLGDTEGLQILCETAGFGYVGNVRVWMPSLTMLEMELISNVFLTFYVVFLVICM